MGNWKHSVEINIEISIGARGARKDLGAPGAEMRNWNRGMT